MIDVPRLAPTAFLADEDVKKIHAAALHLLAHTGLHLPHAEARGMLLAAGAREDDEGRVLLPA